MPCFHPLDAFHCRDLVAGGSASVSFVDRTSRSVSCVPIKLPCGQCVGCRLERSRQWAVRCMHEAQMFERNCFITLTYAPEHLPYVSGTDVPNLVLSDYQKFMKRLRKRFSGFEPVPNGDGSDSYPIRFFHCGEYGEKKGRPHFHACLFNFDFEDKRPWRRSETGHQLWRSAALEELWPFGNSEIGSVTFQSAAYVARYIMKKVNGKSADSHYGAFIDLVTGEILSRNPEYTTMSRRPGIGSLWFDEFHKDVFPHDYVVVNGRRCRPPKYYDDKLKAVSPGTFEEIKHERFLNSQNHLDNNTPERLAVREKVQLAQLSSLKRKID